MISFHSDGLDRARSRLAAWLYRSRGRRFQDKSEKVRKDAVPNCRIYRIPAILRRMIHKITIFNRILKQPLARSVNFQFCHKNEDIAAKASEKSVNLILTSGRSGWGPGLLPGVRLLEVVPHRAAGRAAGHNQPARKSSSRPQMLAEKMHVSLR